MKYTEFFQAIRELKMTISGSFLPQCYCIYLSKDLRTYVIKSHLTMRDMTDVSCFFIVGIYNWQNFTYTNTSSVLLGIFNDKLEPINSIKFKKIEFTGIEFTGDYSNPYQKYYPCFYIQDIKTREHLGLNIDCSIEGFQQVLDRIWKVEDKK